MRYSEQTPCAVRNCKGARSNDLAVTLVGPSGQISERTASLPLGGVWSASGGSYFHDPIPQTRPETRIIVLGAGALAQRARALGVTV